METKENLLLCFVAAVVLTFVVLTSFGCIRDAVEPTTEVPKANGMPLDAVRYRSPTFADGDAAWRVEDRQSGSRWWLIRMGSEWLVLPIPVPAQ